MISSQNLILRKWMQDNLPILRSADYQRSHIEDVTVVAYYYKKDKEEMDSSFWRTEFAFLQTFKTQGLLPSVLVVNTPTRYIESFCDKYSIMLQVEKSLVAGQLKPLALDLVGNLHLRFDTPYVLTIQDDGFPMRQGLEEFVGKWDYIGAPWVKHATYYDLYPTKYRVGNGGFSLRSKRLCEISSAVYHKWFNKMPYWWYLLGDDTFYCKTLRFWFRSAVKDMLWPTLEVASRFSVECDVGIVPKVPPLGFHSNQGFLLYNRSCSNESN